MALSQEIKDYIDSLFKNMDFVANGSRMPGSETGEHSMISGVNNAANAPHSAAIGSNNEVKLDANSATALGDHSIAYSPYQLVHGKYNAIDANDNYAHIVGGGTDEFEGRKNIYTLDWDGNATFAGTVRSQQEPSDNNDLVSLDYLRKQVAIQYFPSTLSADGLMSIICVNDLEPYTIYKVQPEGQSRIIFTVRTETGREITFYNTDLSVNRFNMFVGAKTEDTITLFMNATIYTINMQSGKIAVTHDTAYDNTINNDTQLPSEEEVVDDNAISANSTWSSNKLSTLFYDIDEALEKNFSRVEIEGNYEYLAFYNDKGKEIDRVELPLLWRMDEDCVEIWNRSQIKITAGNEGKPGQVLTFKEIDEHNEVVGVWVDASFSSGGGNIGGGFIDPDYPGDDIQPSDPDDPFVPSEPSSPGYYETDAEYVRYYNGNIVNVKQALDKLLYVKPSITSFTASPAPGDYEIGSYISSVEFSWAVSKAVGSQSITDIGSIDPTLRTIKYKEPFYENKTFTLSIKEDESLGNGTATASLSYNFKHKRYWGTSSATTGFDDDFITELGSAEFATGRAKGSFNVNADSGKYIYYCYPEKWGSPTFNVGGFDGGFTLAGKIDFTNLSDYTETYVIWRSENPGLGSVNIIVK